MILGQMHSVPLWVYERKPAPFWVCPLPVVSGNIRKYITADDRYGRLRCRRLSFGILPLLIQVLQQMLTHLHGNSSYVQYLVLQKSHFTQPVWVWILRHLEHFGILSWVVCLSLQNVYLNILLSNMWPHREYWHVLYYKCFYHGYHEL